MKVYPVYQHAYGDFDVAYDALLAVYDSQAAAQEYADKLNSRRTQEDLDQEVEYRVGARVPYNEQPRRKAS